ncbi:MAG: hypothetical protein U9O98_06020, partial [Asgard group archaeon]|nr:hypothetical protein [Asgard group archaeon]
VQCNVYSLNKPLRKKYTMGWLGDKFITNLEKYNFIKDLDKKCTFEWRQGVKHDCSKVMILYELAKNTYKNNMGEKWKLETELLYPFLKSSDLQQFAYDGTTNRRILITQKRLGMETNYIQTNYPKTWKYLQNHKKLLAKRKSKIYQNQPPFSLFGIGAYAFSPYKVAIASMYKEAQFILLTQMEQKPIMLDDTCYYLSFENYSTALFTNSILNTPIVKEFLSAITSHRKQRVYTKSILSRIGLEALIQKISYQDIKNIWTKEKFKPKLNNPEKAYEIFRQKILNKEH